MKSLQSNEFKVMHRIENIWFRRLHDVFTVTEDIMKRKHDLKGCLRRRAKYLKTMIGRCLIVGWHLLCPAESRTMDGGGKAEHGSDGNEEDSTRA
jgi:hypothetical protein